MKLYRKLAAIVMAAFIALLACSCDSSGSSKLGINNAHGVTVNDLAGVTEETIKLLKENGITFVRIPFMYPYQADGVSLTPAYIRSKKAAEMFNEAGITVMGQTFWPGGMGYNAAKGGVVWNSNIPEVYTDFDDPYFYTISKNAVKYMSEDLKNLVDIWLISNEPDIRTYTGAMTPQQICDFLIECAEGVKQGNPDAKCGINFLGKVNTSYSLSFVEALYGEGSFFDWIGLDGYYGTLQEGGPETWDDYINEFHNAAPDFPVIITEWSYSSATKDPKKTCKYAWNGHERGPETQADYVKACMEIFSKHPEVKGTLWYALCDQSGVCWECGDPECNLYSSWGLIDTENKAKPSVKAFGEVLVK